MFGDFVRSRRKEIGLTLREFCRRLGEDPSNWSKVERGVLGPPVRREKLWRVADALGIAEGSDEWGELVDAALIGAGGMPGYIREKKEVYGVLPGLLRSLGGASLTAEEIRRLVDRLVASLEDDAGKAADAWTGRRAIVLAGPNGAGKTTFVREYLEAHDVPYISADEIAEGMTGGDISDVAMGAGRMFFARLNDAVGKGKSFIVETTLSGRGFRRVLRDLKREGFHVTVVFVYLDSPGCCIARIRERTMRGGHHIPEEDVVRRYHRSIVNFWKIYRTEADDWHLVCNSSQDLIEVARGCGGERLVFDPGSYDSFLEAGGLSDEE